MKHCLFLLFAVSLLGGPFACRGAENAPAQARTKEFTITGKYINIPLGAQTTGTTLEFFIDSVLLGRFNLDLQEENPSSWGFLDVSLYKGKTAAIVVENCSTDLSRITNGDTLPGNEPLYGEALRPQYHFTSKRGWLNDPNGLIYYKGTYHMYYQYNPLSVFWGNMSWGHAESDDLIHWKEKAPVLYPLPQTGECFTGACFLDKENRLGLSTGSEDVILAFYLRTNSGLSYAYSNDGGATFTDYAKNPIVAKAVGSERIDSPKPIYHPASKRWVAPVFDHRFFPDENRNSMTVSIYSSSDLKSWTRESDIGEVDLNAECPDLFPLPLDGDPEKTRWILVLGNAAYVVGDFDGKRMYCDRTGQPATYRDFITTIPPHGHYYATMTWDNIPDKDGRRIQIAWMKKEFNEGATFRGMPFNQQMSLPMELTLRSTSDGPRVFMNPVKEITSLRSKPVVSRKNFTLRQGRNMLAGVRGEQLEICLKASTRPASEFELDIRGVKVSYDPSEGILQVDGHPTALAPEENTVDLRIFVDTRSLEIIGNRGRVYIPRLQEFEKEGYSLESSGGDLTIEALNVYPLRSIWNE